jgi:hypothetical protein
VTLILDQVVFEKEPEFDAQSKKKKIPEDGVAKS